MRSRSLTSFVLAFVTIVLGGSLLLAQNTSSKKTFGYQDANGTFHPVGLGVADPMATAATTGTFKVTLNITVKSTFPSASVRTIDCAIDVVGSAMVGTTSVSMSMYTEHAAVRATGSGTTYSCTITMPYSWVLPANAFQKSVLGEYMVTVNNSAVSVAPAVLRLSEGTFVSSPTIPATGTTSTYTLNVVI